LQGMVVNTTTKHVSHQQRDLIFEVNGRREDTNRCENKAKKKRKSREGVDRCIASKTARRKEGEACMERIRKGPKAMFTTLMGMEYRMRLEKHCLLSTGPFSGG